jgi:hypothetical protein
MPLWSSPCLRQSKSGLLVHRSRIACSRFLLGMKSIYEIEGPWCSTRERCWPAIHIPRAPSALPGLQWAT